MKNVYLLLFFSLVLFSCRSERTGDFTIVKGKVTDEMGNPAAFAPVQIYASKNNQGLFEWRADFEFAKATVRTDEAGRYEHAFFNKLDAKHYVSPQIDSIYEICDFLGKELELAEINEDLDFVVTRKKPLLRVNFIKENEENDYIIQIAPENCRYSYLWDTLKFVNLEMQQTHIINANPDETLIFSVLSIEEDEFSDFPPIIISLQDTIFTTTDEISEVDFILY